MTIQEATGSVAVSAHQEGLSQQQATKKNRVCEASLSDGVATWSSFTVV
jgi:hypothetical protein